MAKKNDSGKQVLGALNDFAEITKKQFDVMHKRFELIATQLGIISKDVKDMKESQKDLSGDIKMLKEDIVALGKSVYKHDAILENQRKRIYALERR